MNEHPPWEGIGWVILAIVLLFVLVAVTRAASGMSTGTAKTPQAVEGQSPASPVAATSGETPPLSAEPPAE